MHVAVEQFRWERAEDGYHWIEAASLLQRRTHINPAHREKRFLVPRANEGRVFVYNPLESEPTLFREFATLKLPNGEAAEIAFAEFASRYGPLGVGEILAQNGPLISGEPVSRWWEEWGGLGQVVQVLEILESRDLERLQQIIDVDDERAQLRIEGEHGASFSLLAHKDHHRRWLWGHALEASDRTERLARFAKGWVQDRINERLNGKRDGAGVSARVLFSPERSAFGLHLVPVSLLAAMWLQCARVLTAGMSFRACEQCRKWFEVSPDARRKHTRYCSPRCRVAAYRARALANR
jgi:hypothetical protein